MFDLKKVFSPKVLSALAVIGVVATAIVAAADGISAEDKIREAKKSFPKDKEKTFLSVSAHMIPRVTPSFAKTIIVGGLTIVCIVASSYLSGLQIAALTGTVTYVVAQRDAIEKEIVKLPGGKEALTKVKKEVAKATAERKIEEDSKPKAPWKSQTIEDTGYGDDLMLDEWSGRLYLSDHEIVEKQLAAFNRERDEGYDIPFTDSHEENIPLASPYNDIFIAQNLEPTGMGYQYGWPANDDVYDHREIPFKIERYKLEDMDPVQQKRYGQDIYVVSIPPAYYPMECWQEI